MSEHHDPLTASDVDRLEKIAWDVDVLRAVATIRAACVERDRWRKATMIWREHTIERRMREVSQRARAERAEQERDRYRQANLDHKHELVAATAEVESLRAEVERLTQDRDRLGRLLGAEVKRTMDAETGEIRALQMVSESTSEYVAARVRAEAAESALAASRERTALLGDVAAAARELRLTERLLQIVSSPVSQATVAGNVLARQGTLDATLAALDAWERKQENASGSCSVD